MFTLYVDDIISTGGNVHLYTDDTILHVPALRLT